MHRTHGEQRKKRSVPSRVRDKCAERCVIGGPWRIVREEGNVLEVLVQWQDEVEEVSATWREEGKEVSFACRWEVDGRGRRVGVWQSANW